MKLLGEVRPMTAADLEGVARLEAVCFSESWSENLLRSGLDCSLDTYLVYALEGQVVGYCVFRRENFRGLRWSRNLRARESPGN